MKISLTKTVSNLISLVAFLFISHSLIGQIHYCEDFHNAQYCTGVSSSSSGPVANLGTLTGNAPNQTYNYTGSSTQGFFYGTLTGDFSGFNSLDNNGESNQYVKVDYYNGLTNLALAWNNTDAYICFESNVLDVACADGYVSFKIYIDASDPDLDAGDYLDVYYVADGVETHVSDLTGGNSGFTISGSSNITTVCLSDIPVSNTFQLKICAINNSSSETYWVDNIIIDATGPNANCTSIPCFTPLPIELVSFDGQAEDRFNLLKWTTATEENTEWHIIERSLDGKNNWAEVGRTAAEGWSTNMQYYSLQDENPLATSYYRLKSLDFDGHIDFSDLVVVERAIEGFSITNIFPKPADDFLTVQFEVGQDAEILISITDLSGRLLSYTSYQVQDGLHTKRIPLDGLSSGLYLINMENGDQKITEKFLKK